MQIAKWKSYGAQIVVSKANVSNLEETRSLLDEANVLGPVAAIFNLAAVRMSFFFIPILVCGTCEYVNLYRNILLFDTPSPS